MIPLVLKESFLEHRKSIRLLVEIGVILLAVIFLLLPGLLRGEELPVGDKPYYHLRMASSWSGEDELSFSGRDNINARGWNFLLRGIPLKVALFAMGLISLGLIFLILKPLTLTERLLSTAFFIISPAFIYLFGVGERFGIGFLFSLLVFYFLINKKKSLAGISFIFIPFFDYGIALFVLFLGLLWFLYKKKGLFSVLIFSFLVFVLIFGRWQKNFISDLGAVVGISIFALFFILFCFILFWNKRKFLYLYALFAGLFLFSLKFEVGIFYFSLFLSVFMALCFLELYKIRWESKLLRDLTLLVVVCGLLFSGLSYANRLSQGMPTEGLFKALDKIPAGSVVFSDIEYGNWISYGGKKNVWDSFTNVDDFKIREGEISRLLDSRDAFEIKEILIKYGVDYILVDPKLKERWEEKGLMYVLRYNDEFFGKIYDDEEYMIWRFL